jgi:hypothetical protein
MPRPETDMSTGVLGCGFHGCSLRGSGADARRLPEDFVEEPHMLWPFYQSEFRTSHADSVHPNVRSGSGTEIPCDLGTSGSMRIAAFELTSQACQQLTFRSVGYNKVCVAWHEREPRQNFRLMTGRHTKRYIISQPYETVELPKSVEEHKAWCYCLALSLLTASPLVHLAYNSLGNWGCLGTIHRRPPWFLVGHSGFEWAQ